jgi:integrase
VLASAPALLIHPTDSDLQPLGQLPWRQNIFRFHPVFTRDLHAVIGGLMRLVCLGYVTNYVTILKRATAVTNALSNAADIVKVQEWLGHANLSTTRLYDRRKTRPEDSPTFHVRF